MDYFESMFDGAVDLDDLRTYPDDWTMLTSHALWRKAWKRAGESLFYMQFIYPEIGASKQVYRVYRMCQQLVDMRELALEGTPKGHIAVMKWLYRFEDEVENQC
jgi:hypothetical protein